MTTEQEIPEDEITGWDKLRIITETDEEDRLAWGDLYPYKRQILNWLNKPIEGEAKQ